jgi:hypothetical protein
MNRDIKHKNMRDPKVSKTSIAGGRLPNLIQGVGFLQSQAVQVSAESVEVIGRGNQQSVGCGR